MFPSDVNNSARANMGGEKRWWVRANPVFTTAGSSTVYTLTYGAAAAAYYDGELHSFVMDETCGAAPTLNINGLGARNLRKFVSGAWANLGAGDLVANQVVTTRYNLAATTFDVISVAPSTLSSAQPGLLWGMTMTRPSTTTLTVAAGTATNSTNVIGITLASAMTKSTAGSWAAGNNSNGMGAGLTIANTTWYHVFAIINAAAADVYFDTSISAANAPSGTTAFRRIGSVKTNGSAQIIDFVQDGDRFMWVVATADFSANPLTTPITVNIPTGLSLIWDGTVSIISSGGATYVATFYDFGVSTSKREVTAAATGTATNMSTSIPLLVRTSTTATIVTSVSGTPGGVTTVNTNGWYDRRGRDA